jgi:hypothetical protein
VLQGIVGNLASGKSALVHRYLTGTYVQEESPEGMLFWQTVSSSREFSWPRFPLAYSKSWLSYIPRQEKEQSTKQQKSVPMLLFWWCCQPASYVHFTLALGAKESNHESC